MKKRDEFRNRIHFSAPRGWINDPNGFSHFGGVYHLFYQHNPYDSVWGPMHWGHAISENLVSWRHLPIALAPSEPYDRDGCFSGTAVEVDGKHLLVYTGHRILKGDEAPAGDCFRQVQCVAVGDGESYRKIRGNPVIGSNLVPPEGSRSDFRDPKLWREGAQWYLLVASRGEGPGGELLLYRAEDLEHWEYVGVALHGAGSFGTVWECPDFFVHDDAEVLIWSAKHVPREGCRYRNSYSSVYSVGKLYRAIGSFSGSRAEQLDYGPDFYAPQTLRAPDGRRILIAWMQMWDRSIPTDDLKLGWAGSMTIPREVEVEGDVLIQRPIAELDQCRSNPRQVDEEISGERSYRGIHGHSLELQVRFENIDASELIVVVKAGDREQTVLSFEVAQRILTLDRSRSGLEIRSTTDGSADVQRYCCELESYSGTLTLHIILDRSSCEVFADGGRKVLSSTVYPAEQSDGVRFIAQGGRARLRCEAWDLSRPELPSSRSHR